MFQLFLLNVADRVPFIRAIVGSFFHFFFACGLCFACGLVDFLMDYVIMMDFIMDYVVMMDFCEL